MQPPQYPYQPAPQPPQKRNIWRWYRARNPFIQVGLGCVTLIVVLFTGVFCTAGIAVATGHGVQPTPTSQSAAISTPTPAPTRIPTLAPTTAPTQVPTAKPTATSIPPTSTPIPTQKPAPTTSAGDPAKALLGGTLADFVARYGSLNSHSNASKGEYYFSLYGAGKDDLSLTFLYNTHTDGIVYAAPDPQMWTYNQARSACLALLPSDAVYQRKMTVPTVGDEQLVYVIPSLANLFPASVWTDENGNPAKPGTVGLILSHANATTYVECVIQVGLEN